MKKIKLPQSRTEALLSGGCQWMGGAITHDEFCNKPRCKLASGERSPYCTHHTEISRRSDRRMTDTRANTLSDYMTDKEANPDFKRYYPEDSLNVKTQ